MIRNDINFLPDHLNKVFLEHRDGIDPNDYRIGKINNEILVWSPSNNLLMDYYYDDKPEIKTFKVSIAYKEISDDYTIT